MRNCNTVYIIRVQPCGTPVIQWITHLTNFLFIFFLFFFWEREDADHTRTKRNLFHIGPKFLSSNLKLQFLLNSQQCLFRNISVQQSLEHFLQNDKKYISRSFWNFKASNPTLNVTSIILLSLMSHHPAPPSIWSNF